jgi:hypothetical protein
MADEDRSRSLVWNYFDKLINDKDCFGVCKVNTCKQRIKCITGSTSSLRGHLQSLHLARHDELIEQEKLRDEEKARNQVFYTIYFGKRIMNVNCEMYLLSSTKLDFQFNH